MLKIYLISLLQNDNVLNHLLKDVLENIYIFTAVIYEEAVIFVAVHFSVKKIKLSRDLSRTLGWSYVDVSL